MKEIAIILPAYNAEKTIGSTIESILNQSYDNYELIIVNDHSSDETENICKRYEKNNSEKIRFFNNIENKKGVSSARNYGISISNSRYIMFIDSDDTYEKNMLSEMRLNIQENDFVICGIRKKINDQAEEINNICQEQIATNINQKKMIIEELQKNDLFNGPCNKIFKSEIIKKSNIKFPEDISLGEDYRFVLDYTEQADSIKAINKVLYIYNRKQTGLALKYDKNNLKTRLNNLIYHKNFYIRNNLDTYYLDKSYIVTIFSGFAEIVRNNPKKEAKKIIKEYIDDKALNEELDKIYNKKLKLFINILKIKNVQIDYSLGKIYNFIKKIYKTCKK